MIQDELSFEELEPVNLIKTSINNDQESNLTLAERIEKERIAKQPSQPFSIKQLSKMKLRFDLVIQRNLRWTEEDGTYLIESVFLGYPIPPVYVLKSLDKSLWLLDGKQRLSWLTSFVRDEWELRTCVVYGVDVTGLKYSQLPEELRELIDLQFINVYQFESLTIDQRDQLFKRLNSGKPLSSIELIRSILGTEMLDYINKLIDSPFIKKVGITEAQQKGFKDQEMILQMISVITGRSYDIGGKFLGNIAIDLRVNGLTESEHLTIQRTFDFLSKAFREVEPKTAKKSLKKADVIRIAGAAVEATDKPEVFGHIISSYIASQPSGSLYKGTTSKQSASASSVKKGIEILQGILVVEKQKTA